MRIRFVDTSCLDTNEGSAALLPGEKRVTILIERCGCGASERIARDLTALIDQWAQEDWVYTGDIDTAHLRAVGE